MARLRLPAWAAGRDTVWFAAIGLCGAAVRVAFAWQYTRVPLGQFPWVDESSYWTWAQAILRSGWWPLRPFYQDPLYPYWLACLIGVVGPGVAVLRLISAGLGTLTPLVVAWAGRIGLGRAEGFIAGWITAFYGPLIFADGSLEKEGLATFWTALALVLMARLSRSDPLAWAGIAGVAWGLIGLLRSNALIIAPLAAAWLVVRPGAPGTADRGGRGWKAASAFLAGFLLVVAPVAAVNTAISHPHEWLGTTWQLGPNLYIGNGPEATGTYTALPFVRPHPAYEAGDFASEAMRRAGRTLSPGQVSRFWLAQGLKMWVTAPIASLRLLFLKLGLVTHNAEIPDNQDIEFVQLVAAPALAWGFVPFGLVFPLAALGLGRLPRTRFWWFLVLSTGLGLFATALFFVVGRYRVPWVPGLILLASAGVVDLSRMARRGDWRGIVLRAAALGLPAAVLCWWPRADAVPARWGNHLIALGVAEIRAGRLDHGIDILDLARAFSPAMAGFVRQESIGGPLHQLLREAIDLELSRAPAPVDESSQAIPRARLLRQLQERSSRARSLLEARRRATPDDPVANREWGALLLSWPDRPDGRERALDVLKRAARDPGGDPRAALLASMATADPDVLPVAHTGIDPDLRRLATMVQAILKSRAAGSSGRERSAAPSPRRR